MPDFNRRAEGRTRHERVARAVSEEEYWHGLRAARVQDAWNRNHGGNPRESGAGADRSDAVLQAVEIDVGKATWTYRVFRVDGEQIGNCVGPTRQG